MNIFLILLDYILPFPVPAYLRRRRGYGFIFFGPYSDGTPIGQRLSVYFKIHLLTGIKGAEINRTAFVFFILVDNGKADPLWYPALQYMRWERMPLKFYHIQSGATGIV